MAFNVGLYAGLEPTEAQRRLASDLSTLALELAQTPEERITPYLLTQTPDGRVISPDFSQADISELLRWETREDFLESEATLRIRDYILTEKKSPFVVVWISPANEKAGYDEGRIVVGLGERIEGLNRVETYGICVNFKPGEDFFLANALREVAEGEDFSPVRSKEELVTSPVFLKPPEGTEPLDFISQLIHLPEVWKRVKSGEVAALKNQAFEDARRTAGHFMPQIYRSGGQEEFILVGAQMEQAMMTRGWEMRRNSGCGALNSDLVAFPGASPFVHTHSQVDTQGNISVRSESGTFVKNCPYCGKTINTVISAGYTCSCGEKYLGIC